MQKVQLYIQGERVDMFEDESVTITQTIQNIKDISKVFTDFSRTFSVPASKTNNKIFRHYYNSDIANGFDARTKKNANIELNNTPFRTGKIKLEGVDLKNNQPHTYRVTFFGSTVTLKDLLGEDKLNDLVSLSQYDLGYSPESVKGKLITPPSSTNHVIAPLITHTQRLYYDSTTNNDILDSGDLHWFNAEGVHRHGVKWNELKYALRVNKIIEAIEFDYGLEFSSDFFKNTNVDEFNNLFLWLHRKSGKVEDLSGNENVTYSKLINSFAPLGDFLTTTGGSTSGSNISNNGTTVEVRVYNQGGFTPITDSTVTISSVSGVSYNVVVRLNGSTYQTETGKVNSYTFDLNNMPNGTWTITLETATSNSFTDVSWAFTSVQNEGSYTGTISIPSSINIAAIFVFNISKQMPEIKIIDFLSGLFRTFNLTAYVENDIIKVETLDSFYESGRGSNSSTEEAYDITKYIDVNTSSVDVPLIYNDILFKFKDTKTFLANKFGEIQETLQPATSNSFTEIK